MTQPSATAEFETNRSHLMAIAYQMVGEVLLAEDIVQEAWLRWNDVDQKRIRSAKAWLSTTVTRIAIDQLRSARHRREVYTGPWLPEAIIDSESGPARSLELAQECELALLWSLERLTAEERAAFLMRQVFDTPYADIASLLDRSEQSCRKLVSRAKKHLTQSGLRFDASAQKLEEVMTRFAAAVAAGDPAELAKMLSADVVALTDGGGQVTAALIPIEGPNRVAQVFTHIARKNAEMLEGVELTLVNGRPAFVRLSGGRAELIFTLRVNHAGEVCWIYALLNPAKLQSLI